MVVKILLCALVIIVGGGTGIIRYYLYKNSDEEFIRGRYHRKIMENDEANRLIMVIYYRAIMAIAMILIIMS